MADFLNIVLPAGWTSMQPTLMANNTRLGRPGRWQIVENDDYRIWQVKVSYVRSEYETQDDLRFDDLHNFFLVSGAAYCFKVEIPDDYQSSDRKGTGAVQLVNGVYRLMKGYPFNGSYYYHPITRPNGTITLGGGATGGTVNASTGVVTGISAAGTWSGKFYRPMVFAEDALSYQIGADGIVEAMSVALEEQLEI